MNAIKTLDRPGTSIVFEVPGTRYIVTLTWTEAGQTFTVTVDQGTYRLYELGSVHDLVNDPHAETKARQRARVLAAGLRDGMSVEALAQCVAMATVGQQVLDAPAAEINDRFDAITRPEPEMQVGTATLAPYRPVVGQREIPARRVNSRAHLQPLTGPQLRTIRNHRDGVVYCGKGTGVSPATLRSIASKGYGQVIRNGARQFEVTGLRLSAAAIKAVA